MKKAIAITVVLTLVLATVSGCQSSSPRGGSAFEDEGFNLAVPTFTTEIKQGQTQNVTISLERGKYFKQDVELRIEAAKGISIYPTKVMVKASDKPDVQIRISASKDSALSEYRVSVMGTPETGQPASTQFNVKVIAP
jgi:uncharacterized membrane protein